MNHTSEQTASTQMHATATAPERTKVKKSDIVLRVMALRAEVADAERKILAALATALDQRSLALHKWDAAIDVHLAERIVRHVSSVKGNLPLPAIVQDVDILVSRYEREC